MRLFLPISLAIAALLLAQHTPEGEQNPLVGDRAAVEAGAKLFAQTCEACHGSQARGGRAPALGRDALKHGEKDAQVFANIRNGIPSTQMPSFPALSTEETWQLVAYVRSLSVPPEVATLPPAGDPAAGWDIFYGKGTCSSCHEINGRGGVIGPELSSAGTLTAEALHQKILEPGNTDRPEGEPRLHQPLPTAIVRTRDGRETRGVLHNQDTHSLQVIDSTGRLRLFEKEKLASFRTEEKSFMPDDFGKRLSASEVENLVAYLKTLNGRDLDQARTAPIAGGVTFERIRNAMAEPQNWFTYWGDYRGTHYSPLKQINTVNVRRLQAAWAVQMPGDLRMESTPVVVDGIMYTSGPPGQVFALDARTGLQIWKYQRNQKVATNPYDENRGVAVLGNRVFVGTLDASLVALDARTGRLLWEAQVADPREGYSITSPPLAIKDKVIVGISGGEYGIRGFVDAYDAATGQRLWRFYTIPGSGEFGNETWKGDSWRHGGGATWLTGTYDPDLDLIFWPVGNPGPDLDGAVRQGDNLFSCSVVALDPATGQRKWHYQFTPGDTHDWDSTQDMVLVDRLFRRRQRKLLLHADRNGMFYVLDRTNGKLLSATAFVKQTWNTGFDQNGRPKVVPGSESSADGSIAVFPASGGGTNFQSPSYSPETGWFYVAYLEYGERFFSVPSEYDPGKVYWSGWLQGAANSSAAGIRAIDPDSGKVVWDHRLFMGSGNNGVLATNGNVLFAATADGYLIALDARTGKSMWRFQTGGTMAAAPMSYAVDGRQYVAVAAANVMYAFALPH